MTLKHWLAIGFLAAAAFPTKATAQVSRVGATFPAWASPTRGSAIAYDSKNDVYLAVSAAGTLRGRFIHPDGVPLGSEFVIQTTGNYTHFPRVAYSPDVDGGAGGFLVTWHESDQGLNPTSVHCRVVSSARGLVGTDIQIPGTSSFWEVGAAVAYSTVSGTFLITWRGFAPADIHAVRVDINGRPMGGAFPLSAAGAHEDNPNVAYNPQTNEFLVVHTSFTSFSELIGRRVNAGTGQQVGAVVIAQAVGIYITDVAYNSLTGQYLAAWYQDPPRALYGRLLNGDGSPAGNINALSSRYAAYDALSVAHNRASGTFFAISHDLISPRNGGTVEDGGVEISGGAVPLTAGVAVTAAGGTGNFYPRIAAHATRPEWVAVTAGSFTTTLAQRLHTAARSGAAPPPAPGPTPPTAPATRLFVDQPQSGGSYPGRLTVAGWAVDTAAASGTGVDAVHVWAFPASGGAGIFVGAATTGLSRPDVGAFFGSSRYTPSGYQLVGRLTPGTYDVGVYARSTVAGSFNTVKVIRVVITTPPSEPRMVVDSPAVNQDVPCCAPTLLVSGWAVDLTGADGSGVDAVHVWAYPVVNGVHGAAVWVGAATLGVPRGDVAAAFGMPQLAASGYVLSGTLPRGEYDLVVFARSTVTGTFNNWIIVRIRVV